MPGRPPYFFSKSVTTDGFIDHRLAQIGTDYEPKALIRMIIDFFRHGWTRLLKKTRLGCAMGMAILAKGYTKV